MDIGQRLAVLVPGVHQGRDQIVGRVLLALFDMVGEIGGHVVDRAHQGVIILDAKFEDLVDPLDEAGRRPFPGIPSIWAIARTGMCLV